MPVLPLSAAAWQFRDATVKSKWRTAVVPGCVHLDLLRHKLIPDPFWGNNEAQVQWIEDRDWEYRAVFAITARLLDEEAIELVADGLDTVATVLVNGKVVAQTENMFIGHRWDVKSFLRRGNNEVLVRFGSAMEYIRTHRTDHRPRELNDPVGRCAVIRKHQCQFGWDWGPRLVTAGIWRDLRLEAWSENRLDSVRLHQTHRADGSVALQLLPELARPAEDVTLTWDLSLQGKKVGRGTGPEAIVAEPQLWWPKGQGEQPLYEIAVEAHGADGVSLGRWARKIGLRTIMLDRHADQWGESFQFVVNGRAIFAKGANWIPAHSFVAGLSQADYRRDLVSAVEANMNMIRVWGGGIYESEEFYDLCDELGLLVWQDFMFACTRYPGDEAFLASSSEEAKFQARRLRHRASLALWCGNNEVAGCNAHELVPDAKKQSDHDELFLTGLPSALRAVDEVTPYWPSSPWRGDMSVDHETGEKRGDTHFWDVWHARKPVKDYEKYVFRFVSEFGMQSYSSPETNATFCPPHEDNIFGPEMENHQKNRFGNQIILDYVSRLYRFPKGQDELIYLSQLNQAYCMQVGVEHWRRSSPQCMGTLFWQLNDCWPVASWSSVEFTGKWKALQHVARRFFAPALVTAHVPGEETNIIGNYRGTTVNDIHLYTVYDAPDTAQGVLRWDLFHVNGRRLKHGVTKVSLKHGESIRQLTLSAGEWFKRHSRDVIYLRIALDVAGRRVSEDTVFLTAPRFMQLPVARTKIDVRLTSGTTALLSFTSTAFQHRFAFDLAGTTHRSSDNFFELYPGERKIVAVDLPRRMTVAQIKRRLKFSSLVDSY